MAMPPYDTHSLVSSANGTDGSEARSKFWIAAYTRPRSERKAASDLQNALHLNTYVPSQDVVRQWSDRKKKIKVVVIPMVIFIEVSTKEEILEIEKNPLIIRILKMPGQSAPAKIPDEQIKQLKFMLCESDEPVEFVKGNFKESDTVKVIRGNLAGLEGVVQRESDGKAFIVIAIDMLGGAKVSIDFSDIELIHRK